MVTIENQNGNTITVQVSITLTGSMLEMEDQIQAAVNEVGRVSTEVALKRFEATGSVLTLGGVRLPSAQ